ncbi:MAG: D-alanyl-D-alanine carboxypeptidase [Clostridia bacterium]|nr:D-alanyl-D-alanine carboxypeptidase [Clostridia bacterium]
MSDFFGSKDYGDYFAALEDRITTEKSAKKEPPKEPLREKSQKVSRQHTENTERSHKPAFKVAPKKNKRAEVRQFKIAFVSVVLALVLGITFVIKSIVDHSKPDSVNNFQYEIVDNSEKYPLFAEYTAKTEAPDESFNYKNIYIANMKTNKVIAAKNPQGKAYPASTTKIMTALVAAENLDNLKETFTMTYEITDPMFKAKATVAGFLSSEVITMEDLLYGCILPSGGDAALGLATHISGSEEEFVKLMNKKAKKLGLLNTNFTNCTGLFDKNHYSTAEDMAVILRAALENDLCKKILCTNRYTSSKTTQHPDGIEMQNTIFQYMYGTEPEGATVLAGKTGFVNESGYCFASYGKSDKGTEYVIVTFGGTGKWPSVTALIDLYSKYAK